MNEDREARRFQALRRAGFRCAFCGVPATVEWLSVETIDDRLGCCAACDRCAQARVAAHELEERQRTAREERLQEIKDRHQGDA